MLTQIQRFATKKHVLIFLGLDLILMFVIMPIMGGKMAEVTEHAKPLDLEIPTYSVEFAHEKIEAYGEAGRQLYKTIELTADVIYPLIYGFAYALLIAFFFQRAFPAQSWTKWLLLVPLATTVSDLAENLSIVSLLNAFPEQPNHLAQLAATFSLMKWSLILSTFVIILLGLVLFLIKNRKAKQEQREAVRS
ncbi:MAG: hypothetical protein AAF587_00245 [Bacteroidota bacterium]